MIEARLESDYWQVFLHANRAVEFAYPALEDLGLIKEAERLRKLLPVDEHTVRLFIETAGAISNQIAKERLKTLRERQKTDIYTKYNDTETRQFLCEMAISLFCINCIQTEEAYNEIKKNLTRPESKSLRAVSKNARL